MSQLPGYLVNLHSASYDEPGGVVLEVGLGGWACVSEIEDIEVMLFRS